MELCISLDIIQEKMNELFNGLEPYVDDLSIVSNGNFEDHLNKNKIISKKFKVAGCIINAEKSFFDRDNLEYLH